MVGSRDVAALAFRALRQHPLRSLLSTLGLVIGVAALVGVLTLADGMEKFIRDEIESTTNLHTILVAPSRFERVDGVTLRRDSLTVLGLSEAAALEAQLRGKARVTVLQQRSTEVLLDTVRTAATLIATDADIWSLRALEVREGRVFTPDEVERASPVVVVSSGLAERLGHPDRHVVGARVRFGEIEAQVIGIVAGPGPAPASAYGPFPVFVQDPEENAPGMVAQVAQAEEVPLVAAEIEAWVDSSLSGGSAGFRVETDEMRTRQVRRGMLLFKVVMGLITGISVLVGGIGVMNVLLITVTERTHEIGIRKSVGARRRDIRLQFLAEAMVVAGAGSLLGLLLGWAGTFAVAPLIRSLSEVPFRPVLTWQTAAVVGAVAVAVGLVFGTYPALRAARLRPIDAIRRE
jgi:putative ABC transport system permease protein